PRRRHSLAPPPLPLPGNGFAATRPSTAAIHRVGPEAPDAPRAQAANRGRRFPPSPAAAENNGARRREPPERLPCTAAQRTRGVGVAYRSSRRSACALGFASSAKRIE